MRPLLVIFAALALLAAACSDDGDLSSLETGSGDLTLAEWLEAADAICAEAGDELDALVEPTSEAEAAEAIDDGRRIFESTVTELTALGLPDEKADVAEQAIDVVEEQAGIAAQMSDALAEDDEERFDELLEEGDASDEELDELAAELGLEECRRGEGGSSDVDPDGGDDAAQGRDGDDLDDIDLDDGGSGGGDGSDLDVGLEEGDTYGDNPVLDALWDACEAGDGTACDDLWATSGVGTGYEEFGGTCGYEYPSLEDSPISCETDVLDGDTYGDAYGDDPVLDALWDACEAGDGGACDTLYIDSPVGSAYELYGGTCGARYSIEESPLLCDGEI